MTEKVYDESSFDVLEGLEPVRQVPGMYTRTKNPLHIIQEVIDNAIDEAQNGYASRVAVTVNADGSVSIGDNGRGIPVGIKEGVGVPVVVLAFTRLHAGAKFRKGDTYGRSGGLHGVGVAVTNALSTRLEVDVARDGKMFHVEFEGGDRRISPVAEVKSNVSTTGTRVRVWPDPKYFDSPTIPLGELENLLRSKAMLLPGITITYKNESSGDVKSWKYDEGISAYLKEKIGDAEIIGEMFSASGKVENDSDSIRAGDGAIWSVVWTLESGGGESYVNMIHTPQGGTHEAGLRAGLYDALKAYCDHHAMMPRGVTLQAEDVWSRAKYILSASITQTQFQGQTKDKLTSREAVRLVSSVVRDPFEHWLINNPDPAKKIAELVIRQAVSRAKQGKVVEKRKSSGVATLPGKLTDCQSTDPARTELFLVEGDSAGGSAKGARDKECQAILPLRGKILNTFEVDRTELFGNQEVHDISVAIGVDPHDTIESADLSRLRYGKIIIQTDADVDGSHIQCLLLTLFYQHFPALIAFGHIYIALPPLFRIDVPAIGKKKPARKIYCLDETERDSVKATLLAEGVKDTQISISRFKGLGEMNPDQLWETTMNPDTRRLVRVGIPVAEQDETVSAFKLMMKKSESDARCAWMEEEGDAAEIDI